MLSHSIPNQTVPWGQAIHVPFPFLDVKAPGNLLVAVNNARVIPPAAQNVNWKFALCVTSVGHLSRFVHRDERRGRNWKFVFQHSELIDDRAGALTAVLNIEH